jgi:hypothetical protein
MPLSLGLARNAGVGAATASLLHLPVSEAVIAVTLRRFADITSGERNA